MKPYLINENVYHANGYKIIDLFYSDGFVERITVKGKNNESSRPIQNQAGHISST